MSMSKELIEKAKAAREAGYVLGNLSIDKRNAALSAIADALEKNIASILKANAVDMVDAEKNGIKGNMLDRLMLNESRIRDIASATRDIVKLPDVLDESESWTRPNGLQITRKRVPMGLIGIIYESRPNVTVDAAVLCLKSGNATLLRGGEEAVNTNMELIRVMRDAIKKVGVPADAVQGLKDVSRETAQQMMRLHQYIDVLIPRGGAGLIRVVRESASIPVIETGTGNCHVYVDEYANLEMAMNILINAKCQRPSVCNAAETLLVHKKIAKEFLPLVKKELGERGVELRGCEATQKIIECTPATEDDFLTEFNNLIMAVKIVDSVDAAISHINQYNSRHSDCIISDNADSVTKFGNTVDAAAVYINTSTRFTDGYEFGFGAEIGISTQKLHARGPMGIKELTTVKYVVNSDGVIRGVNP
jgi:glutamate-5-semialdehyde dehydrogenase